MTQYDLIQLLFITLLLSIPFVLLFIGVYTLATRLLLRRLFRTQYGVRLPWAFSVRKAKTSDMTGFRLVFPQWRFANKDGSRDMRRRENSLVGGAGSLCDGDLVVRAKDPLLLYAMVLALRASGFDVPFSAQEEKGSAAALAHRRSMRRISKAASAHDLLASFGGDHRAFEHWCAELLATEGWVTEVTQQASDGGYDVVGRRHGHTLVAECKLYGEGASIGRPLVQKLVGAGKGAGAHFLVFMTTSRFTRQAMEYADQVGVRLLDGGALSSMAPALLEDEAVSYEDELFSVEDLFAFYPPDVNAYSDLSGSGAPIPSSYHMRLFRRAAQAV